MAAPGRKRTEVDIRSRAEYADRLRKRYRRRLLAAWWRWLLRTLRHRRGAAQLHALDERALHDLGLTRSNIDAAARGLYR
ncbi:hypothetical protein [Thiobacillus sp.]|uniref:hypothetical protein n=1 Tax=Thiobacillus sp. TaxID=924 RepID=UPI001AD08376|nr:hypothetical protein [Thiobacillus sp.]MBN8779894.1 hypothetical protein [Thiobacillus sp.]